MNPNLLSSTRSTLSRLVEGFCARADERQRAAVARRDLQRELASYRTPSDIRDLLATMARRSDASEAEQVSSIVAGNQADYRRGQRLTDVI